VNTAATAAGRHGAPAAPAGWTAPGQPFGSSTGVGALAPHSGAQRRGAPHPAHDRPVALLPAQAPAAGSPDVDFVGASRCPSPDAHQPSREPGTGGSGPPRPSGRHRDQPRVPVRSAGLAPVRAGLESSFASDTEPLLLTKEDAARRLSISVRQVSRFIADGSLTPVRLGPRLVRFTADDLLTFVARRSREAEPPAWPGRLSRHGR